MTTNETILTGDRTTGPLHLGHFAGSLANRVRLQHEHEQYLLLADAQAMTDTMHDIGRVRRSILDVAIDYLACGIDPSLTTICLQSAMPALADLTMLYLNLVTVSRLERNPTIGAEITHRAFDRAIPAGFLCYPAAQAADITGFRATLVPAGADQAPMIEQTNEIVTRINRLADREVLSPCRALIPEAGRLPGPDGKGKMSKSAGNAITFSATDAEISGVVMTMFTDPDHVRVSDPGKVEGNVVFAYLYAFDPRRDEVDDLADRYRRGGLGDMMLKRPLKQVLIDLIAPIRERRMSIAARPDDVRDIIREGTLRGRERTASTLELVREALGISNRIYGF